MKMSSITSDLREVKADVKSILARTNAYAERLENIIKVAEDLACSVKEIVKSNAEGRENIHKDINNLAIKIRGLDTQTKVQWGALGAIGLAIITEFVIRIFSK